MRGFGVSWQRRSQMGSGINITCNIFISPFSPFSLLPMSALRALQAINMGTHQYSPPTHATSHEQPWTWCLVALVGAFAAPSSVLLRTWQVHQDLGIIDTHLFCTPPLMNNPGLSVWLLCWECSLPPPLVLLPTWPVHQDLSIIGTGLFRTPPLTNNPGLDVWLLQWERSLPLPLVLLPTWPISQGHQEALEVIDTGHQSSTS